MYIGGEYCFLQQKGVIPLASSRDTQNGPDWKDVARAAQEYAQQWQGVVTLSLRPYGTGKHSKMTVIAQLWPEVAAIGVVPPLASASVNLPGNAAGDTDVALLLALYELDKEVYRREIGMPAPR